MPAAELTYVAVVNGCDLWVAGDAPAPRTPRLALVHRHRREARLLPTPSAADLAGQDLPPGTVLAAGPLGPLLTREDEGTWDLAVVGQDGTPELLRLSERAQLYPTGPVRPMAGPDGVVATPYRTEDGRAAIGVSVAAPSVEVATLVHEPGRLALTLRLCRWVGAEPTCLVLDQRRGPGHLTIPLETSGGRASVTLPVRLLAGALEETPASVWDVAVQGPAGRTPCGRTARDVDAPRRVYRYPALDHRPTGHPLSLRPYFTNDRTLALEVDAVPQTPSDS